MFVIGGCHEMSYDLLSASDGYCSKLLLLLKIDKYPLFSKKPKSNLEMFNSLIRVINDHDFFILATHKHDDKPNDSLKWLFKTFLLLEKKKKSYIITDSNFINKDNFEIVNKFTERTCKSGFVMFPPKYMSIYHFCKSKGFPHNELYHYGPEAHTAWAQYIYDNYMEWKTKK